MTLKLGCIADDFTGATDIGLLVKQAGFSVIQTNGVPKTDDLPDSDAIVAALKSRTNPAKEAVQQTADAYNALTTLGSSQTYFKICSTFDSTAKGNIGPVADYLLQATAADVAVVCPAFPANGRTVYKGNLFVNDQPLAESPMRNHPLTPMRDSNLVRLLQAQSNNHIDLVTLEQVEGGPQALRGVFQQAINNAKRLLVVDAISEQHLDIIGEAVLDHSLIIGGSALGASLVRARVKTAADAASHLKPDSIEMPQGASVALAGSCSQATLDQIAHAKTKMPALKLDIDEIAKGNFRLSRVLQWTQSALESGPVLIYASENAEERADRKSAVNSELIGERIEQAMAELVPALAESGVRRFVVAGGETSGAVVDSLGVKYLHIGDEIDPGVPWTVSSGPVKVGLALKSGNFGGEDFFTKALALADGMSQ